MAVASKILEHVGFRFIDIMIGVILGTSFQWWPNLVFGWQFIAFLFVYLDITDYWIDYSPSLRKFPPKRELDFLIDVLIMFSIFLYVYSTQLTILYFLSAYILFNILDIIWLLRAHREYHPSAADGAFLKTWIFYNVVETFYSGGIMLVVVAFGLSPLVAVLTFIALRLVTRVLASFQYKRVYFL